jgi:uncharacterized protein (TIGR00369 family)
VSPKRAARDRSAANWKVDMDDMFTRGREVLASQPFSVLLRAELLVFTAGRAELSIPIREELKQQHGFVHGGVLSYAADNALTFAGGTALGPNVVTSEFKINYVRPAVGDAIVARALVVHAGKNQAVCRCDVFVLRQGHERLCATAQGTITLLSPSSASTTGTSA